jgi:hypothetical protein
MSKIKYVKYSTNHVWTTCLVEMPSLERGAVYIGEGRGCERKKIFNCAENGNA